MSCSYDIFASSFPSERKRRVVQTPSARRRSCRFNLSIDDAVPLNVSPPSATGDVTSDVVAVASVARAGFEAKLIAPSRWLLDADNDPQLQPTTMNYGYSTDI